MNKPCNVLMAGSLTIGLLLMSLPTPAQQPSLRWQRLRQAREAVTFPASIRVIRDVAYGRDSRQRFDVYVPAHAEHAPLILMVHGGGWRRGDKAMPNVIENKVSRWVTRGIIVISTNYRAP